MNTRILYIIAGVVLLIGVAWLFGAKKAEKRVTLEVGGFAPAGVFPPGTIYLACASRSISACEGDGFCKLSGYCYFGGNLPLSSDNTPENIELAMRACSRPKTITDCDSVAFKGVPICNWTNMCLPK